MLLTVLLALVRPYSPPPTHTHMHSGQLSKGNDVSSRGVGAHPQVGVLFHGPPRQYLEERQVTTDVIKTGLPSTLDIFRKDWTWAIPVLISGRHGGGFKSLQRRRR